MENQYTAIITGEGSKRDIIEALKNIVKGLEYTSLNVGYIGEDSTLFTEIKPLLEQEERDSFNQSMKF